MRPAGIWKQRLATLQAMTFLAAARTMIRLLPLRSYRWMLGSLQASALSGEPHPGHSTPSEASFRLARRIERAAMRLPGESKCLAKAMALHWMLRHSGESGQLVIAIHRSERDAPHAYHAWLESGGAMLVGACDRTEYRELMRFAFVSETVRQPRAKAS